MGLTLLTCDPFIPYSATDPNPDAPCVELTRLDVAKLTAATAALRNLSFQNGANRVNIRFSGGLEPLLAIVAQVQHMGRQ